jgi:hypothetical protein
MLPRYGSLGGSASAALAASGVVRLGAAGPTTFGLGLLVHLTGDSWFNTVGAPDRAQPCGTLSSARSATALSLFAVGSAGWELTPRIRAHALAGAGAATYFAGDLGGDVFTPACSPSPAPKPALLLGAQLDYALTPVVRLSALPLLLQVQPAFDGARTTPVDASGAWLRATFALGAGVDL